MQSGFKSLLLAGLLASAGFASLAQTANQDTARAPMMAASGSMHADGHKGMHGRRMNSARMEARMAKRHDALKAKLKLTPEQEAGWTTFTAAMKPPARMTEKHPDRAELSKLTTPERIDKMHALRTEHMAAMNSALDKREEAIKTFYATLNADQKKVFDTEHARMGDRHGEHHGGRHGHGAAWGADKPAGKK